MNNQNQQQVKSSKPKWLVLVIVVVGVIVLGLVVWWVYSLLKPVPVPEDQTADWKTYRNEEYGFEIKYPEDWEILDHGKGISFRNKKYDGSWEWPGLRIDTVDAIEEFKNAKESKVFDEIDAVNDVIRIYFIENGNKIYASCTLYNYQEINSTINICNQILSTFKFLK